MKCGSRLLLVSLFTAFCFFYFGDGVGLATDKEIAKQEAKGKNTFKVWGSIRFRYENQDNFNAIYYGPSPATGKDSDAFTLGRFRFGFSYHPNENIHLSVGMQHSAVWDLAMNDDEFYKPIFEKPNNPYKDYWEPFNTYIEIKNYLPFSIKAGRQQIYYGNNRVFGPGNWGNSSRWIWDAIKLHYPYSRGFLDAYYGQTMVHDPTIFSWNHSGGFKSVGFYGQFKLPKNF